VIDGAYKAPREINFWFGMVLLLLVLGLSLTGYLLPWDQKGFWATKVATLLPGGIAPDVAITPGFTAESRTVVVTVYWKLPGESDKHQHIMTAQIGKNAP